MKQYFFVMVSDIDVTKIIHTNIAIFMFKGIFPWIYFFFDMLFALKSYEKKSSTVYENNFSIES